MVLVSAVIALHPPASTFYALLERLLLQRMLGLLLVRLGLLPPEQPCLVDNRPRGREVEGEAPRRRQNRNRRVSWKLKIFTSTRTLRRLGFQGAC